MPVLYFSIATFLVRSHSRQYYAKINPQLTSWTDWLCIVQYGAKYSLADCLLVNLFLFVLEILWDANIEFDQCGSR